MSFTTPVFEPEIIRAQITKGGEQLVREGREPRTTAVRQIQLYGVMLHNPQGYADALKIMEEMLRAIPKDIVDDFLTMTADGDTGVFDIFAEIDDEDVPIVAREVRGAFLHLYGLVMPMRVRNANGIEAAFDAEMGQ